MTTFLTFTVLALVLGAVYAIAASGLVLTYTTSGVFNFAHGAQAMIGAFAYYQLNTEYGLPAPVALLLVLAVLAPVMGLLLYLAIMRGLRDTEEITRIVVTVAVLLGLVALAQWIWDPQQPRVPQMFFGPDSTISVWGVVIRYHELICLATALALAIGLRLLFTRTRLGVLMRATVDDPDLLRLAGHDPDRVSALAWVVGSCLAVLAGVLITPVVGGALEATALTFLVIDASAAALFGRLRSIPLTFVGAIVLGLASTYLVAYAPVEWTWVGNLRKALPMVLLFVVLLVLPQDRLRGVAVRSRERYVVPTVRRAAIWAVVLVGAVFAVRQLIDPSSVGTLTLGMSFAIIALSLTVLTGYAGEVNLAPLAFSAVATIVAFHSGIEGTGLNARMTLSGVLAGVTAAALTGALVALPALRLRGLYLALATLAFGVFVSSMLLRDTLEHTLFGRTFTIFPNGLLLMPRLKVGPLDLADDDTFLLVTTAVFGVVGVVVVALRNSGYGRRLAAMKDSPAASAMLGQRLVRLKLGVFALSTAIAGLGGIFMAMALSAVNAEQYVLTMGLSLVMLTVVGGIGYVSGALFGGLVAGIGLTMTVGLFTEIGATHPEYVGSLGVLSHLLLVGAALAGMGVARDPSGFLHEVFVGHRRLAAAPEIRYGALAIQAVLYVAAWRDVIPTAWFVVLSAVLWLSLPALGAALRPSKVLVPGQVPQMMPELVGVDTPRPPGLADRLDADLGLPARVTREVRHVPA